jgi:predicted RND superfamily exporter protein
MRIYSTANIWDMVELKEFVNNVRDIDPKATGSPLQTYESSLQMQQGFITAAVYAVGAIFILLLIDFRSWGASVTTLLPTILGFTMMFGVMGWLDLPLNAANMIVLPLILGIGIDDGVHLIHDYRSRRNDRRYKMSASTATSMMITSLTTIIGFGSMMIASHRGLQSLGRVLVIGIVCCLFTSLILLPVLIKIFTAQSGSKNSNPSKPDEPTETNIHVETTISQNFPNNSNNSQKQKRLVRREEF